MSAAGDCPQTMEGSPEKSRPGPPALQSRFFDKSGKRARFFWFGARCSESRADEHNFGSAGSTGTRTLVPDVLRQCTGRQCSIQCHCTSAADGPERSQSGHLPKKVPGPKNSDCPSRPEYRNETHPHPPSGHTRVPPKRHPGSVL